MNNLPTPESLRNSFVPDVSRTPAMELERICAILQAEGLREKEQTTIDVIYGFYESPEAALLEAQGFQLKFISSHDSFYSINLTISWARHTYN